MTGATGRSTRSRGLEYLKQLNKLKIESQRAGTVQCNDSGKVRRSWIIDKLGCSPDLLSTNTKIRQLLRDWDADLHGANSTIDQAPPLVEQPHSDENVIDLRKARKQRSSSLNWQIRHIEVRGENGLIHSVPTPYRNGKMRHERAADWSRYLVIYDKQQAASAEKCLVALRKFLEFIQIKNISEESVDDEVLTIWMEFMLSRNLKAARISFCLSAVHRYYQYLEGSHILYCRVQVYDQAQFPEGLPPYFVFPISSDRVERRTKHGLIERGWTTTIKVPGSHEVATSRSTPTRDHAGRAHAKTAFQKHGTRNSIIMSIAETAGGRISEILQLRLSQLPTHDQLSEILQRNGFWEVQVRRKKRKELGSLTLNGYVLLRIARYVENERAAVVARYPDRAIVDALFLSDRGTDLKADSATHIVIDLFDGILEKAGIHRLRAKFAHDELLKLFRNALERGLEVNPNSDFVETFLTVVAKKMGQASVESLRPYLPLVFGRELATTRAALAEETEARLRETKLLLVDVDRRIAERESLLQRYDSLVSALQQYDLGNKAVAARQLVGLANSWEPNIAVLAA